MNQTCPASRAASNFLQKQPGAAAPQHAVALSRRPSNFTRILPLLKCQLLLIAAAAGILVWPTTAAPSPVTADAIYQRATSHVEKVVLFKPVEGQGEGLTQKLTPLILQEVRSTNAVECTRAAWGALPGENTTNPVVYTQEQTLSWQGGFLPQVLFLWFYPPQGKGQTDAFAGLPCQGVRITLNAAGQPVLWEMLATTNGWREIYAAGSLEHAAWQQHQSRQPGRRHFLEPLISAQTKVIVPLIVEDSAVVFGPMIYLAADSRATHTVICRCMPAQARAIAGMAYYQIKPLPADWRQRLRPRPDAQAIIELVDSFAKHPATECLRLPDSF